MSAGRKSMSDEVEAFHKWLSNPDGFDLTEAQKKRFDTWQEVDEIIQRHGPGTEAAKIVALQLDVSNSHAVQLIQQTISALGFATKGTRQYFRSWLIAENQKGYHKANSIDDLASAAKFLANLNRLTGANMADDAEADGNKMLPTMIAFVPIREQLEANKISTSDMKQLEERMQALNIEEAEIVD